MFFFSSCRGFSAEIEIYVIRIPVGTISQDKTNSFVYKIAFVDEKHLHAGRHYYLTALNESLRISRETIFRLIQAFNWFKNNFGEIHISQELDWAFQSLSPRENLISSHVRITCYLYM